MMYLYLKSKTVVCTTVYNNNTNNYIFYHVAEFNTQIEDVLIQKDMVIRME